MEQKEVESDVVKNKIIRCSRDGGIGEPNIVVNGGRLEQVIVLILGYRY